MLPDFTVPPSLSLLLAALRPCFTAPTFTTFCGLLYGMLAQTGRRTVTGMLVGAGLSRRWSHDRAHRFFSHARWCPDALGLAPALLVVGLPVPDSEPVPVAVDDTLFTRSGPKVWAAGWFHDGSVKGNQPVGYGNNWVVLGIVVHLPILDRPVCLPVLARLVRKNTTSSSRLWLATQMADKLATALPGRKLDVVADAAYAGDYLRALPASVTWTTRLRKDAALYDLAPPRTGKRGRPRLKGDRLGSPAQLAATATFTPVKVRRYGQETTVMTATIRCLWYGCSARCRSPSSSCATAPAGSVPTTWPW
ncbi:transposase, IS4 [Candidatus Protofrankia californiensis]|uniref:Transposase, IS4 n=1 Tax=Candidatus Protofrankia californiensis TaxID=1839754 RepID=A0A1C3NX47_9ACTN|nr:transposase, IS4 [Candidatus Protofrankia californiensis]